MVVGERGGHVLRWPVQTLVAFPGQAHLAGFRILSDSGPQCLVGGSHLTRDIASHLSRQLVDQADFIVAIALQGPSAAHLAMGETVPADVVQSITIR